MTLDELADLLLELTEGFRESPTHWQFTHAGIPMACLSDVSHDRMRFIAPITDITNLDEPTKDRILEANFHSTLDARYASSNGLLFAAFIHPLGALDEVQVRSALDQVASLVHTFGTHFSSGHLEFVGGSDPEDELDDLDGPDDEDDGPLLN